MKCVLLSLTNCLSNKRRSQVLYNGKRSYPFGDLFYFALTLFIYK